MFGAPSRYRVSRTVGRRAILRAAGVGATASLVGCLGGSGGDSATDGSAFPAGSCLAAVTEEVADPAYGFEFSEGASPELGGSEATTTGDVTVSDGVATFGENGGEIRVEGVPAVDDLTVSAFAGPAVTAEDQWNVMVWYSPLDRNWSGWGLEHGTGAVDFWAEGPAEESTEVLTKSDSGLATDTWTHLVGVKRGDQLTLYVDGEEAATSTFDPGQISYGGADSVAMVLGKHAGSGAGDRYYQGDLDSVAVWDEALPADAVDALLSVSDGCR
jgi:hypothetical protein